MNDHTHMLHDKFQDANDLPAPQRNTVLPGSLEALVRSRAVKKDPILQSGSLKKKDMLLSAESQVCKL